MAEEGFGISQEHPKFNCSSKIHSFFSFSFLSIPWAIVQLMQLKSLGFVVVMDNSTTVLKIIVPALIKRLYRKFTALLRRGSVHSRCFEEDTQNGHQQAATFEEAMKFWCQGYFHNFNCEHDPENPHDLTFAPIPPGSYHLYKHLFLWLQ